MIFQKRQFFNLKREYTIYNKWEMFVFQEFGVKNQTDKKICSLTQDVHTVGVELASLTEFFTFGLIFYHFKKEF